MAVPTADSYHALYARLAGVLTYPDDSYLDRLDGLITVLAADRRAATLAEEGVLGRLHHLHTWLAGLTPGEREEAWTVTFDLKPRCVLACGYQVFGDSYKRGRLLAGLRGACERHGIPQLPHRLPDDLPVLLELLPALLADGPGGEEEAADLLSACVFPALEKMEAAFADGADPFGALIGAVAAVVRLDHPAALEAVPEYVMAFPEPATEAVRP
jgi:nitrate reductase delta subunit